MYQLRDKEAGEGRQAGVWHRPSEGGVEGEGGRGNSAAPGGGLQNSGFTSRKSENESRSSAKTPGRGAIYSSGYIIITRARSDVGRRYVYVYGRTMLVMWRARCSICLRGVY